MRAYHALRAVFTGFGRARGGGGPFSVRLVSLYFKIFKGVSGNLFGGGFPEIFRGFQVGGVRAPASDFFRKGVFSYERPGRGYPKAARRKNVGDFEQGVVVIPIPVYRSHPDSESFPDALDKTTYGTVEKVYAGNRGVMARIAWGNEFHRLPKHMLFSPRWRMNRQADGTFRPVELISVGLTHNPNIGGTDFANSTNSTQTKGNTMLKNILIALGFTEEQAAAAETNAEGAPTEESILERIGKLKEKPAEAENPAEAKPAEAAMENETLRKALSAERAARAKMVVDNCLAEGRMSQAETATAIEILSNAKDFDAAAKLFTSRAAVWKPSSKTENLGARNTEEAANEAAEAARADRITARAQEICANEKIPWRQAYARAESECKQ